MSDGLKWVEVFKAGRHISSNGLEREYTPGELDQAVQTYNPEHFKAPLIVSYPAHNTAGYSDTDLSKSQLAYGYPEKLKRVGDRLMAGFKKLSPKVKEWINNGEILGFSSSFYLPHAKTNPYPGNLSLRHIAGCGINPPAVKGMEAPELAEPLANFADYHENEEGAVEFALEGVDEQTLADARLGVQVYQALRAVDSSLASFMAPMDGGAGAVAYAVGEIYQRMRDRLIEEKGVEEANQVFPSHLLDNLKSVSNQPSAMVPTWEDFERLNARIDELIYGDKTKPYFQEGDTVNADFQAKLTQLETENSTLRTQIEDIQNQRERERVSNFVEGLVRDRKLLPADKEKEVSFIMNQPNDETADYGEEGEITPRQAYMNKLSKGRELWNDKKLPIGPGDGPTDFSDLPAFEEGFSIDSIKQDRAIRARCAQLGKDPNDVTNYEEAWDALVREGALSRSF